MIGRILGGFIGNRIDRRDGSGGVKGALLGALAVGVMRRMGPLGLVLGGAYAAKQMYDARKKDVPPAR